MMCTATHAHLGLGGRVKTWVWLVVPPVVGLTSFCCLTLSAPLLPQVERQLAAHTQVVKQAEVSLCAAVSGAVVTTDAAAATEQGTLSDELARIESEQREQVQPRLSQLEASLQLAVGPFDKAALERRLCLAVHVFSGEVRGGGLPPLQVAACHQDWSGWGETQKRRARHRSARRSSAR